MKKILIILLTVVSSTVFTNGAIAQNKPFACQTEAAAGLKWENGRWITKTFETNKFILVQAQNTLTQDSVAKALGTIPLFVTCRENVGSNSQIECTDRSGGGIYFSPKNLNGGISQLLGSTVLGAVRDTVTAEVFSCTAF